MATDQKIIRNNHPKTCKDGIGGNRYTDCGGSAIPLFWDG